jgi:hypothetical protein
MPSAQSLPRVSGEQLQRFWKMIHLWPTGIRRLP